MTTVTVAEAREALLDLIRRATAGEQIVIADGGKWVAALAAPPAPPPTAREVAAAEARARAAVVSMLRQQIADGCRPPEGSKVWALLAEEDALAQAAHVDALSRLIAQWHEEHGLSDPSMDSSPERSQPESPAT